MSPAAVRPYRFLVTLGCGYKYVSPLVFDVTNMVFFVHVRILTCFATRLIVCTFSFVLYYVSICARGFPITPMMDTAIEWLGKILHSFGNITIIWRSINDVTRRTGTVKFSTAPNHSFACNCPMWKCSFITPSTLTDSFVAAFSLGYPTRLIIVAHSFFSNSLLNKFSTAPVSTMVLTGYRVLEVTPTITCPL